MNSEGELTYDGKPFEFIRSARRHLIGIEHARHVMRTVVPVYVPREAGTFGAELIWIGSDDRGVELEVIASERPDAWLVFHVMPTFRR